MQVRADALDSLGVPVPGDAFAWEISNPSVATLDTLYGQSVTVTPVGGGAFTLVVHVEGAEGRVPFAVPDPITALALGVGSEALAVGGTTQLTTTATRASGAIFERVPATYASSAPSIAIVDAQGLVSALANGTAEFTATVDGVTSAPRGVTVAPGTPSAIRFVVDTLVVGASTHFQIAARLSRPHTAPLTVTLTQSGTALSLEGQGTTTQYEIPMFVPALTDDLIFAQDGIVRIVATADDTTVTGDTLIVDVRRTVQTADPLVRPLGLERPQRFTLSSPAPPGGLTVVLASEGTGRFSVSPDLVHVPGGERSFTVNVRGSAVGVGRIRVTGDSTFPSVLEGAVQAGDLGVQFHGAVVGSRQQFGPWVVHRDLNQVGPLTFTVESSDSSVFRPPPPITLPDGLLGVALYPEAALPGTATVTVSAPGRPTRTAPIRVLASRVRICCHGDVWTPSPATGIRVWLADTVGAVRRLVKDLQVQLEMSNPALGTVVPSVVTIAAGDSTATVNALVVPSGVGGGSWVRATAAGLRSDSIYLVFQPPRALISTRVVTVGVDQIAADVAFHLQTFTTGPTTFFLSSTDTTVVHVPDSVVVPSGSQGTTFPVRGLRPGVARVRAAADGYASDSTTVFVNPYRRLDLAGGGSYRMSATPPALRVTATDTADQVRHVATDFPLILESTDTTVVRVPRADTIEAGAAFSTNSLVTLVGPGSANVVVRAAHLPMELIRPDTVTYHVEPARLFLTFTTVNVGRRQYFPEHAFEVVAVDPQVAPLEVTFTQKRADIVQILVPTRTIGAGAHKLAFGLAGLGSGSDTIIVSAPGFLPDTGIVRVIGTSLTVASVPSGLTERGLPTPLVVGIRDSIGGVNPSLDTLLVAVRSSDSGVAVGSPTAVRILPGTTTATATILLPGPGAATLTLADSLGTGYSPAQAGPIVVLAAASAPVVTSSWATQPPRTISDTNRLRVTLGFVDTTQARTVRLTVDDPALLSVPDSVIVAVGTRFANFAIETFGDTGTTRIRATLEGAPEEGVSPPIHVVPKRPRVATSELSPRVTPAELYLFFNEFFQPQFTPSEDFHVRVRSSDSTVIRADSVVPVLAGQGTVIGPYITARRTGIATVTVEDPRPNPSYLPAERVIEVLPIGPITFSTDFHGEVGLGQVLSGNISLEDNALEPRTVQLSSSGYAQVPPTVVVPILGTGTTLDFVGRALGFDTVRAVRDGQQAGMRPIKVTRGRTLLSPWVPPLLKVGDSVLVTLTTATDNGTVTAVAEATTFELISDSVVVFRSGGAVGLPVNSVTVPGRQSSVEIWIRAERPGYTIIAVEHPWYVRTVLALQVHQ